MDSFVLQAIAHELDALLKGARVERVTQPGPLTVVLLCAGPGRGGRRLLLSADPAHPRLHLTEARPAAPAEAPAFCRVLRKHLVGCRVVRAAAGDWERVVQLSLERPGGEAYALMAEVMGRWSNIVLLEGRTGRILDAIKSVSAERSRRRPLLRGATYRLPPPQEKRAPEELDEAGFERLWERAGAAGGREAAAWLVRSFAGISPAVAGEVVRRAGGEPDGKGLWAAFSEAVGAYRERRFRAAVVLDARGLPGGLAALEPRGLGPGRVRLWPSMNEAADAFYASATERAALAARRREIGRSLQRAAKRLRRAIDAVERDLGEAEGAEELRRKGELLLENLGRVAEKTSSFLAEEDGRRVEIALDPRLPPSANAQRYFRRYKRLKRLLSAGGARREGLEGERAFLEGLQFDLEQAESLGDLEGVEEALVSAGYRKGPRARKKGPARPPARLWRRFLCPGGWEIFVGRSALGNEALLRRVGRAGDTWLHARGIPGSHVLLRMPGGGGAGGPPEEALLQAGALAAYFSRARADSKVRVDHLPVHRLRRPRGARPGQVIFTGQRTLLASPAEGERLAGELEAVE